MAVFSLPTGGKNCPHRRPVESLRIKCFGEPATHLARFSVTRLQHLIMIGLPNKDRKH
jgi:hypothetical protein